jgi:hypothetical protein
MRTTGCASASALTICGVSAPSGRLLAIRATASRVSVAATSMSASSANSSVTRLRPKRELDEIDRTPATRPTAPSIRLVTSWSTVSGEAPGKSVVTEMTGRSTFGSSRTSTPKRLAMPAMTMSALSTKARIGRRTKSAVPERPAISAVVCFMDASRPGFRCRAAPRARPASVVAEASVTISTAAPGRRVWTPSMMTRSPGAERAFDQHAVGVALADDDGHALRRALARHPDEGAVARPLDRQRIDRGQAFAREGQRDRERLPRAQAVVGVVDLSLHAQGPARAVHHVVERDDAAFEHRVRPRERRDVERHPEREAADEAFGHAEVDLDAGAVGDDGDGVLRADPVAAFDVEKADPARDRREDAPLREVELGLLHFELGRAQRQLRLAQLHRRDGARAPEASEPFEVAGGVRHHEPRAFERDAFGIGVEFGDERPGLDVAAGLDRDLADHARRLGPDRDGADRAPVADGRDPGVRLPGFGGGDDDLHGAAAEAAPAVLRGSFGGRLEPQKA